LVNSRTFRAFAVAVVPEMSALDEGGWSEAGAAIDRVLQSRPPKMRRQLAMFLRILELLPLSRYGRRLHSLDPARRLRFLQSLETSRVTLIRRGVWGLRTLVLLGYYTRPETMQSVGYRATARGWQARAETAR
jgi:hypothetical protein